MKIRSQSETTLFAAGVFTVLQEVEFIFLQKIIIYSASYSFERSRNPGLLEFTALTDWLQALQTVRR